MCQVKDGHMKFSTSIRTLVALLCCFSLLACANQIQLGADAYALGEYDKAVKYWNPLAKSGNPYAEYNLGLIWEGGLGNTPLNTAEASQWYLLSAKQGFAPAMVRLANLQRIGGYEDSALSWLNLAARWGNQDAITALNAWGKRVPADDLLAQKQYNDAVADVRAAEVAASLMNVLGCAIVDGSCAPKQTTPPVTSRHRSTAPSSNYRSNIASPVKRNTSYSVVVDKQCTSDYACGAGFTCVKSPLKSSGVCMKSVNDYGTPQYNLPRSSSVGVNMDIDGQCQLDTGCPVGFQCDKILKACVKR